MTYGNLCEAHAAGVDAAYAGECAAMADCRTTGCPMGQRCDACLTSGGVEYFCLPTGLAC